LKQFLYTLPSEGVRVFEDDSDTLTVDEEKQLYPIHLKTARGDFSDFDDWDSFKSTLVIVGSAEKDFSN